MPARSGDAIRCPRCRRQLRGGSYSEVRLAICESCDGTLVRQRDLPSLLAKIATDLAGAIGAAIDVPAVPDKGAGVSCPLCEQAMENHGYLSTRKVIIDTCSSCRAVWFDSEELARASILHVQAETGRPRPMFERVDVQAEQLWLASYQTQLLLRSRFSPGGLLVRSVHH